MTQPSTSPNDKPRLPHEQDESTDSQTQGKNGAVMRQAHADVVSGQRDTDRAPVADMAYEKQKGGGAQGTSPASPDRSGTPTPRG